MIVIGLSGYARAGKNSVADILTRDHGFVQMSFAAPLKKMLRTLDPMLGVEYSYGDSWGLTVAGALDRFGEEGIKGHYEYGGEYRRLLQVLGTDCIRAIDPEFWVKAARKELLELPDDSRVVFTDCRFPNEAEMIHELRAVQWVENDHPGYWDDSGHTTSVWQVSRPGIELTEDSHESEKWVGLMGEEYVILNDGTLEDLAEPVKVGLDYMLRGHPDGFEAISEAFPFLKGTE